MNEAGSADIAAEWFLAEALKYLDGVRAADDEFWAAVLEPLDKVEVAMQCGDTTSTTRAVEELRRVLSWRAIPIGSEPATPMPETVRELCTIIRHRLGATASPAPPADPPTERTAAQGSTSGNRYRRSV